MMCSCVLAKGIIRIKGAIKKEYYFNVLTEKPEVIGERTGVRTQLDLHSGD